MFKRDFVSLISEDLSDSYAVQMHLDDFYGYVRNVLGYGISQSDFTPRFLPGNNQLTVTFPQDPAVITFPFPHEYRNGADDSRIGQLEYMLRKLAVQAKMHVDLGDIPEKYQNAWPLVSSDLTQPKAPFSVLTLPVFEGMNTINFKIGQALLNLMAEKELRGNKETVDYNNPVDVDEFEKQAGRAFDQFDVEAGSIQHIYRMRAFDHFAAIVEATSTRASDERCGVRFSEPVDRGLFYDCRIVTYVRHSYEPVSPVKHLWTRIEYRYLHLKQDPGQLRAIYNAFC